MKNALLFLLLTAVAGFFFRPPSALWAQDAAEVMRQSGQEGQEIRSQEERERERLRRMEEQSPDVRLETGAAEFSDEAYPADEKPCMLISAVALEGDLAEKFQWALEAAESGLGLCLGGQGLNLMVARVQNEVIARGYITTRIAVPPQDLNSGRLTLTVLPGRIGGLRLSDGSQPAVLLRAAFPSGPGDLLNIRDLEQGLENLRRPLTAQAQIDIFPGQGQGQSDVVVSWSQARPIRLNLSVDDAGQTPTGRYQAWGTLILDNAFGFSDILSVTGNLDLHSTKEYDSRSLSFFYSLPFGYNLLTMAYSYYQYHQTIVGRYANYEYGGRSRNINLELSRVLQRGADSRTWASVGAFVKRAANTIEGINLDIQNRKMSGWEAALGHRRFIGNLTLEAELRYHRGGGAWGALPAPEERIGLGTSRPEILKFQAQAYYPFTLADQSFSYYGQIRGQWGLDKLVPIDRFFIGGRYSVRGFTGDYTLSGDSGLVVRNELAWNIGQSGQQLYAGIDYGRVWGESTDYLAGHSLSGAALGFRGYWGNFYYDAFVATPIHRPAGFPGGRFVTGFNLGWQF